MDEWPLMFFWLCDRWHMTGGMWHLTPDTSHLTPDMWQLIPDIWHLTHDFFLSFFYNFFKDIFMSVLLTKQDKKFSVSHMRDFFCLEKSARKNHWIREHAHTSLRPPPPPFTVTALGFFQRRFGLFGILGTLWNRFSKILG